MVRQLSHNGLDVVEELLTSPGRVDVNFSGHAVHLNGTPIDRERIALVAGDHGMGRHDALVAFTQTNEELGVSTDRKLLITH